MIMTLILIDNIWYKEIYISMNIYFCILTVSNLLILSVLLKGNHIKQLVLQTLHKCMSELRSWVRTKSGCLALVPAQKKKKPYAVHYNNRIAC